MAENERLRKEAAAKEGEAAEARDAEQAAEEDAKPSKSEGEGYKQLLVSEHFSCSSQLNPKTYTVYGSTLILFFAIRSHA